MSKFLIFGLISCLALPVLAGGTLDLNIFTPGDLEATINRALSLLWIIAVPLAVIMLLWSGIEFITSAGDSKKVTAAKNRIKYTLIGLVVMLLASGAVALVQSLFIEG